MGDMPRRALRSMTDINTALIPVLKLEMDAYDRYAGITPSLNSKGEWRRESC
jgi:hypothetical protein